MERLKKGEADEEDGMKAIALTPIVTSPTGTKDETGANDQTEAKSDKSVTSDESESTYSKRNHYASIDLTK